MKTSVISLENKKVGDIELSESIFAVPVRKDILSRMVTYQLAKRRSGTHKVKERNEISLTGKKFVRQKGSGGARHGARSANLFKGGGVTHGPRVRSHAHKLPKKVRALALKTALSAKLQEEKLLILDQAVLETAKTKDLQAIVTKLGLGSTLIIDGPATNENFSLAARSIVGLDVLPSQGANVYDILRRDTLILTKEGVAALEERLK